MINLKGLKIQSAPSEWSEIFEYKEDLVSLKAKLSKLGSFKNVIVVGNGGSITSYDAYYGALLPSIASETIWTMEPSLLERSRKKYPSNETIVVAVSKSGNTLGQIEALLCFVDYPVVVITNPSKGTLGEIAKRMNWHIVEHPPIGGRFSGGTSSAFAPAILAGINADKIQQGIAEGYKYKDEAYSLSKFYFDLEEKGYSEVYVTCYSELLKNFENLIIQLMHESACKNERGQTFYFSLGPEAQHHTNQRFLGGKRTAIGTFIIVKESSSNLKISVPDKIKEVPYKGETLQMIDDLDYQSALLAEYIGTKTDAEEKEVVNVTIELDKVSAESVGQLVSFWHLVAFYSAILRGVNPFDQPAVERSKDITLEIIKRDFKRTKKQV